MYGHESEINININKGQLSLLPEQHFPKFIEDTKMVCETFHLLLFSLIILKMSTKS